MFFAWSPIRSSALATKIVSSAGEMVRNYPLSALPSDLVDFTVTEPWAAAGEDPSGGGLAGIRTERINSGPTQPA